jgi:hypothetical protein
LPVTQPQTGKGVLRPRLKLDSSQYIEPRIFYSLSVEGCILFVLLVVHLFEIVARALFP